MNWRHPLYEVWLDWKIAISEGRVKFWPNNHVNRQASDAAAIKLFDRLKYADSSIERSAK